MKARPCGDMGQLHKLGLIVNDGQAAQLTACAVSTKGHSIVWTMFMPSQDVMWAVPTLVHMLRKQNSRSQDMP
jgi:hypothetical protein